MPKDFIFKKEAGSQRLHATRLLRSINGDAITRGWHTNTELGCDLKTILLSGQRMKPGKVYSGVLQCDSENIVDEFLCRDSHFTFIETVPSTAHKRNPRLFDGKHISITRCNDGTLRPNFKPMHVDDGFTVERFALGVYNELCMGLGGLIDEG